MPSAAGTTPDQPDGPRVAVVIPCFNDGQFVTDAVASALEQEPCEVVVVDDGSDDPETIRTLDGLPAGVQVVRQPNRGIAAARMAGVESTSARYVQPLDADDRLVPGALAMLADLLDAHPEASAAWGSTRAFGKGDSTFPHWSEFDPWRLIHVNEVPTPLMIRRQPLVEVGGWDLSKSGVEDWDLNLKAAESGWQAVATDQPHADYREHDQSRMLDHAIRNYDELYEVLRERHPRLWAERRRNMKASKSRFTVKLAWSLLDLMPLRSEYTRGKLCHLTRDTFEPAMKPSGVPTLSRRVGRRVGRLLGRGPSDPAAARTRG
jgi:GT2 family glycosyltransferase